MFGKVYYGRLFVGCAIWQLSSLVYFKGGFIAINGNRELLLEQQSPQLQVSSHTINTNSNEDAMLAPLLQGPEKAKIADSNNNFSKLDLSSIRNECFAFNSDQWINGSIFSNNDDGITPGLLDTLIEGPKNLRKLPSLFDQTICHKDSPLRNFSPQTTTNPQNDGGGMDRLASVEDWYQRFLYLALHWKFHRPALDEHRSRKSCASKDTETGTDLLQSFMDHQEIRHMDFECRGTKFVVIPMGSIGFGAFLNTMASLSILLALRTNRIPIFSSKSFFYWQKRKGNQDPWLLAPSHCGRKDMQCYFLPISPCTVTNEDLEAAPLYGSTGKEQRFLFKNMTMPPELENEKVVVLNSGLAAKSMDTPDMRQIASVVVEELLGEWKKAQNEGDISWSDEDWEDMELAHRWITEKTTTDPVGLLRHVYVYMLRPNSHYKDLLERQMSVLVPRAIDPSETIGIAIRGSDKCISESMCLSFDRYMELATDVAYPGLLSSDNTSSSSFPTTADIRPKLIMTTEDPQIFNDSLVYQHNNSFPFQFLVNGNDNMQGSGFPRGFSSGEKEKTIVSSLVALKFHFNAGRVYLNCCSNFHLVLNYLLQGQCGARRHGHDFVFGNNDDSELAPPPVAQCLGNDNIPRRYRICCRWSKKSGICGDIWKEYLREKGESN